MFAVCGLFGLLLVVLDCLLWVCLAVVWFVGVPVSCADFEFVWVALFPFGYVCLCGLCFNVNSVVVSSFSLSLVFEFVRLIVMMY